MTRFQKGFCILLCLVFFGVLAVMPEPFFQWGNLYRHIPLYLFLEEENKRFLWEGDVETRELLVKRNGEYLGLLMETENLGTDTITPMVFPQLKQILTPTPVPTKAPEPMVSQTPEPLASQEAKAASALPWQALDLSPEKLSDRDYVLNRFFVVDQSADPSGAPIDALDFLSQDMTLSQNGGGPQILIYHSHSQEAFADSRENEPSDTVVGVGDSLASILESVYGYRVLHVTKAFDIVDGRTDRSRAYDYARAYVEKMLKKYPSIEVLIDLHRDGVEEGRRLVTEIGGKPTAQIMFYNGLSHTVNQGPVEYLPNPYIKDNLAFSFQLACQADALYPEFSRCIYLAGLRYNLHLRPKALLLEVGAQTNTVQEVKNAMEPFAYILNRVLKGSDKRG